MKKITKFLDSVMGGIKRTCIAKALAVFAVASIAINANAESVGMFDLEGVEKIKGKTMSEIISNAGTTLAFPEEKEKMLFLYNVQTKKFLNVGGYWGTHVSLQEYGKPFWAVKKIKSSFWGTYYSNIVYLTQNMKTNQGNYLSWFPNVMEENKGVFVDRNQKDSYGWGLEITDATTGTCKIYSYYTTSEDTKFYLCANKNQGDVGKNCEGYTEKEIKDNGLSGYDTWRILTYAQIFALQKANSSAQKDNIELSFKLKCPGFQRGDDDITNWTTKTFGTTTTGAGMFFGAEYLNCSTPKWVVTTDKKGNKTEVFTVNKFTDSDKYPNAFPYDFNRTDGTVYTKDSLEAYKREVAKYFCGSVKNTRGAIYQDVVVSLPGTYIIKCKGFSTTEQALLFAGVQDPTNTDKMLDGALNAVHFNQVSKMGETEKANLHINEQNMDYAGKEFYGSNKYFNTVMVTVDKFPAGVTSRTIRFGVIIGNNTDQKTPTEGEWTVFDDFRLQYSSNTPGEDLILDEERDNLNYLVNAKNKFENKTLRLRKTFKKGVWNSFVLPVNLTKQQFLSTFGANARIAQLKTLTETAIEFESVKLNEKTDNELVMQAYMPYIIFPEKLMDVNPTYTATLSNNNNIQYKVNIPANHYTIYKVSLTDFSKIDRDDWTTMLHGGDGKIAAYGTFARTFGTEQKENEDGTYTWTKNGNILPGRDDLKGSYFFDNGKMYHSKNDENYRPRGLRGFSCWFKPVNGKSQNASFTLDGVSQGTTGIEDILADYEQPVSRFANGIYNLNGQLVKQGNSTAGLPSGLYIVNGKKCIVR